MSQSNFERPASASNDDESFGAGTSRMHDESNHSSSLLDADGDSSGSTTSKQPNSVPSSQPDARSARSNPPISQPSAVPATTAAIPAGPVLMLVSADKYDYRLQGGWQKQDYRPLNERYRNWRKNTYFMYDFSTANVTIHPSRTVEWLPDIKKEKLNVPLQADEPFRSTRLPTKSSLPAVDRRKPSLEVEFYCQKAIVGSLDGLEGLRGGVNTAPPSVQHAIFVMDVRIPIDDGEHYDINPPSQFGLNDWGSQTLTRIETTRFVPVGNREVFRVRHMPQLSDLVAVRTRDESYIGIYDLQDSYLFESYPLENVQPNPALALTGFAVGSSGYGLNWHPNVTGYVVAASYEPKIAVWNIEHNSRPPGGGSSVASIKSRRGTASSVSSTLPSTTTEVLPLRVYEYHTKAVQDVAWHPDPSCRSMFVSVGDDGMLGVCDIRESPSLHADFKPALFTKAHDYPINSVAWSPASRDCATLLATGAMDGTIGLWDLRRPDLRLHTIAGTHTADIVQVAFNPHDPLVLASAALDNRLLIFDLGCIGAEKFVNLPQHDLWPSELAFAHDGQSAPVNEFAWNPYYERMLISVADDNMCQVAEISEHAWSAWHKRRHYGPLALSAVPPVERIAGKTALDADEIPAVEEPPTSVAVGVAGTATTSELSRRQQFKLHTAPEFRFPPGIRADNNMNGI